MSKELGAGAWSYFGDPRAIHHDGHTFTGWISTTGNVWVADHVPGRALKKQLIYEGLGRDDHNNPSLVFRRDGHIVVFFSPHSGRHLPEHQVSRMRYRIGLHPYSIREFGPVHTVDTNVPGGLGYTYPNPIQQRDKLWLFWRGGDWNPTFSYTRNGRDWVPARELVKFGHEQRPYAKYVGDGRNRIHGIFTDGHPSSWKTSLHYARYENSALYAASGRRLGTFAQHPAAHVQARPHLPLQRPRRARLGPRHRARQRGPAVRRLHAPPRPHARHLLLRVLQRHALGQPQDRRGGAAGARPTPRAARRSTTRTRASSTSRARIGTWFQVEVWVTGDKGRTWSHAPAHRRPERLLDPPGHAARPPRRRRTRSCSSAATIERSATATTGPVFTRSSSDYVEVMRRVIYAAVLAALLAAAPAYAQDDEAALEAYEIADARPRARGRARRRAQGGQGRGRAAAPAQRRKAERSAHALALPDAPADEVGRWSQTTSACRRFAINAVMLPTGKVAFWGQPPLIGGTRENRGDFYLWDPATGGITAPRRRRRSTSTATASLVPAPLFCSGQSLLADGQLFVAGGNLGNPAYYGGSTPNWRGLDRAYTFDPVDADLARAAAPAARALVSVAGRARRRADRDPRRLRRGRQRHEEHRDGGLHARGRSAAGVGTLDYHPAGNRDTAFYPHLFTLKDGRVFLGGPGQGRLRPARSRAGSDNAVTGSAWTSFPRTNEYRVGGNAILWPQGAPGDSRVTLLGGYTYTADGGVAVDGHGDVRHRRRRPTAGRSTAPASRAMNVGRSYGNVVQLPERRAGRGRRRRGQVRRRRRQLHRRRPAAQAGRAAAARDRRRLAARPGAAEVARVSLDGAAAARRPRALRRRRLLAPRRRAAPRGRRPDGRRRDLLAAVPVRRRRARRRGRRSRTRRRSCPTARRSGSRRPAPRAPCSWRPARRPTART